MNILIFFPRQKFQSIFKFNPEENNREKIQAVIDELVAELRDAHQALEIFQKKEAVKTLMQAIDFMEKRNRLKRTLSKKQKRLKEACAVACDFGFVVYVPPRPEIKV